MSVVVVVGAQWGDEGKGKVVDAHLGEIDLLVHYAGGANPGQTIVAEGERLVLHIVPPGAMRQGKHVLLGQGMVIDPLVLLEELDALTDHGVRSGELQVDLRAHVVMPHHRLLDRLRDEVEGASGIPRRGIGPAYGDKTIRRGAQMGDLLYPERLQYKVEQSLKAHTPLIRELGGQAPPVSAVVDTLAKAGERLRARMVDGSRLVRDAIAAGKRILLEAPLGTMVDPDHGAYPFVVAASTVAGGAAIGAGIPPRAIERVVGVAKCYSTRSGPGPFPAEVTGDLATRLQQTGGEFSATGKPRRCGMLDIPALRFAARVNGFDALALTKLDVLSGLDQIPICVGYELDGKVCDEPPFEGLSRVTPLVETLPGWSEQLSDRRSFDDLPENAKRYVTLIEEITALRIATVGVGPDRSQMLVRDRLL